MNLFEITKLLNLIEEYSELNYNQFVIEQQIHDKYLSNFSFRKTNKENFGSFLVRHNNSNVAYWLLLIRWNENQGFYLIIYPENRSTPLVEIHKFENGNLHWQYNPAKRDGNNAARVQYFQKYFYSSQVVISFPENTTEMEDFLQEIFELVDNRIKADNLDPNNPEERTSFPEGKRIEKKHYSRERNSNLIHFVKEKFKKKNG
jgi:putative restriction endonuclease